MLSKTQPKIVIFGLISNEQHDSYCERKHVKINVLYIVKHKTNKNITLNILFHLTFSLTYYNKLSDHAIKKSA